MRLSFDDAFSMLYSEFGDHASFFCFEPKKSSEIWRLKMAMHLSPRLVVKLAGARVEIAADARYCSA